MIKAGSYDAVKAQGLEALRRAWVRIDPAMEAIVPGLVDWSQTGYMPTGRVRTDRWVADGSALLWRCRPCHESSRLAGDECRPWWMRRWRISFPAG
ncbi:MAG: hypothetical protein MRJ92_04490 [Nitrospira sp.]|nr:hypothetical protein [Nitrospira sp.]